MKIFLKRKEFYYKTSNNKFFLRRTKIMERIKNIEFLRIIGCIAIILVHQFNSALLFGTFPDILLYKNFSKILNCGTLAVDLFLFLPEICADNEFFNELHSGEKINFIFGAKEKNQTVYKTQLYTYYLINDYIFELFRNGMFNGKENEIYAKFINMSALYNIYIQIKEDYEKKNKKLENLEVNLSYNVSDSYILC